MKLVLVCLLGCASGSPFSATADVTVVHGAELHGRAAIDAAMRDVRARFPGSRIVDGRVWRSGDVRVREFVWIANRIGIAAAIVERVDRTGAITSARLYVDVPTLVGQLDPSKLPDGVQARAPITQPIAGAEIIDARGTATEQANLALAVASWTRLDAHDPAGVLASAATSYRYDDMSGPAPLDVAGTRALLERFLGAVDGFTIVAKPTLFAAGDDVITESVEHMTFHGKPVELHGLDIKRFSGGRVVREWQYANGAEALEALLGVILAVP